MNHPETNGHHPAEPPPPYTDTETKGNNTHQQLPLKGAAGFAQQPPPAPSVNRQFPPSFNLYKAGWGKSFTLGQHENETLYFVSTHTGWSGEPDVVLHNGSSKESPPLASINHETFSKSQTVTLPALPGKSSSPATQLRSGGFGSRTFQFDVEVNAPQGGLRSETFEWRHSHGVAVAGLDGRSRGWKLVRLASDTGSTGGGPAAGDGHEVVAVWANNGWSMTKLFKFEFLGSGASGALGERWAVMAVITALGMWERERRQKKSSAAGGAGGGGGC